MVDRMSVNFAHALLSHQGRHQHHQRRLGKMKVRHQGITRLEPVTGRDEDVGLAGPVEAWQGLAGVQGVRLCVAGHFLLPVEDVDDLVDVLRAKPLLGAVFHQSVAGVDHEDAAPGCRAFFVDHHDARGDARAIEEVGGQADDALDVAALQDLLAGTDWDWEEQLSQLTGDVIARQVGNLARRSGQFISDSRHTLEQDVSEYLQEEARLLPTRSEVDDFLHDVDELRSDVDRLNARIERLLKTTDGVT